MIVCVLSLSTGFRSLPEWSAAKKGRTVKGSWSNILAGINRVVDQERTMNDDALAFQWGGEWGWGKNKAYRSSGVPALCPPLHVSCIPAAMAVGSNCSCTGKNQRRNESWTTMTETEGITRKEGGGQLNQRANNFQPHRVFRCCLLVSSDVWWKTTAQCLHANDFLTSLDPL